MWDRLSLETDLFWALLAKAWVEWMALAVIVLVLLQLLWELIRLYGLSQGTATDTVGHRVKLGHPASPDRGSDFSAGLDHAF